MNLELENKLVRRFPALYQNYGDKNSSLYYGVETLDGWFQLIWSMSEELEKFPVTVFQVKNKLGLLRVYLNSINDEWEDDTFE